MMDLLYTIIIYILQALTGHDIQTVVKFNNWVSHHHY